jgi:hypothetical protein
VASLMPAGDAPEAGPAFAITFAGRIKPTNVN